MDHPDAPNTKWVISFDPLDICSYQWSSVEALWQPGKLKDALEVNMLKMRTLIHENAHILSLSSSQSDNDLIGYEELCDDDPGNSSRTYFDAM